MKTDLAKLQKNRDYRAIVVLAVEHLRLRIPFFAGAIQSRESWEMIKRSIDRFYELVTDEQITWLNRILLPQRRARVLQNRTNVGSQPTNRRATHPASIQGRALPLHRDSEPN
jgi:hypothetical protein